MRIYISGLQDSSLDDYANHNATYLSRDEFISTVADNVANGVFIWGYNTPWRNKVEISLEGLDEWNKEQISILSILKKTKKKVILFNESKVPLSYILTSISSQTCKDVVQVCKSLENNPLDDLYLGVFSAWGKKYYTTLNYLEKSPLNYNVKFTGNKKLSSDNQFHLWLKFISKAHENQNVIQSLNKDLRKRFNELANLTSLQEEKVKYYEFEIKKLNDEIASLKTKKDPINSNIDINHSETIILQKELEERNDHIQLLNKEISSQKEVIQFSHKKIDEITNEFNECKQSLDSRFNELVVITNMLELSKRENVKLIEKLNFNNKSNKSERSLNMSSPLKEILKKIGSKGVKNKKNKQIKKSIELIKESPFFDEKWYLEQNLDVQESKIDPARHYFLFGGFENRDPSSRFSSQYYLDFYADVRASGMNPLEHYILYGEREKRVIKSS